MIIRKYFAICIVAVACLVATLCNSCSVEDPFSAGSYTYPMQVDAVLSGYDGASTRSGYDWPDGAKLYVQFYEGEDRVQGFAEYNETNDLWTVTTHTGLSHVSNARCEAYYFGHSAETADVVELSENVAVYQDVAGSYICDANGLFVSLALTPRTGRIRFCGEVGRSFTVSGLTHLSTYEISSNNFSSTSKSLSLTVSEDGYTPYLYASFPEASRTMVIVDGDMEYTRECTESVLAIGKSGCMTIPTTTAHDGWTVDESAVADAIDLGLSVKWASWNVGADSPEEFGGYYAWGETEEKDNYDWSTYKWCKGSEDTQTKYCTSSSNGTVDNKTVLEPEDDVAHVLWGDEWRIPTLDEIQELLDRCTWSWTTQNGVNGYKVTGPNGNSIFLPVAGYRYGTEVYYRGSFSRYWSGTLSENGSYYAYSLYLDSDHDWYYFDRSHGHTVRPVYGAPQSKVSITTGDATDITDGGATLSGTVSNSDKSLTCGIIYGTSSTLSSTSGTMLSTTSSGEFSVSVTGLSSNTTYYYCAYVEVDGEYKYGEVRSFTTEAMSIPAGDAIDLGLSVKWASWNVGADSPEDYGDYFAWGETTTKSSYTEGNSITRGLSVSELESRGIIDADGNLTAAYDAATVNWGSDWRMPTKAEQDELRTECDWEWTKMNGVNGYKVTGPNGNSIFLSAAGYRSGTLCYAGSIGIYWSATPYSSYNAYYIFLDSDHYDGYVYGNCHYGHAVRPVYGPARPSSSVTTGEATDISAVGATLGGIVSNSDKSLTCGIIYGTSSTLSSTSGTMLSTTSSGEFSVSVTGLSPNTTYYYCAYVEVDGEYKYGEVRSFTTEAMSIPAGEAIDLGLSVKWASWNVGADSPEEYGGYYAWGETTTKSSFTEGNSITFGLSVSELESRGIIDADGNLTAAYDAATANWGDEWRMPTKAEQDELRTECDWEWTKMNGVNGYKVTGPNGNSIFLPAAGYRIDTSLGFAGDLGCYWSATPYGDDNGAYYLSFGSGGYDWRNYDRYDGHAVRPVYGPARPSISVTTGEATDISAVGATLGGIVSNSYKSLTCGIIYGTSSTLSSTSGTMLSTTSSGEFSVSVTGLSSNTTYYYCAYVEADGEYKYGEVRSFTTKQSISITTGDATDITDGGATLGGIVSNSYKSLTCGIIYGTSSTLSSTSGTMLSTTSSGEFSVSVTGLSASTTYYYCAYVVVDGEYKYGDVRSFTTEADISITVGEAVDLGLSVKWASCNVGADSPEEYGGYYAWGETKAKSSYTEDNCIIYGLSSSELKSRGIIGSDGNLTAAYDAATVNWGDEWRMPTLDEIKELCNNCSWNWTTQNGINGCKVTGPNGNSIFLPAAGFRYYAEVYSRGSAGNYWSGTVYEYVSGTAYGLGFYSDDHVWSNDCGYHGGRTVRPVYGASKSKVSITTGDATDITDGGATLRGTVSNSDKSLTCGIIYGTSSTLSSTSGTMLSTTSSSEFSVSVTGLSASTTYYYCAYVVVDGEYKYGEVRSFTTEADISITAGDAIDLGLSVKWASCNIGANSPEEYGDYYAWGETTTKSSYSLDNSVTYGLSSSELKSRGIIGSDGNLTAAYDAATVNWGDEWRMPTLDEIKELCNNCSWNWTTQNGINGCKVTGPNGNSIFLPAAGGRRGTEVSYRGSDGLYWSGTLSEDYSDSAYGLWFSSGYHAWSNDDRSYGHTVRPVTAK